MEHDSDSPATSESQTSTFPVEGGGNAAGMAGVMPQIAGMMPGYYNIYSWAGMGGMMPQMVSMSATITGMSGGMMGGMMHGMRAGKGEGGIMPQMAGMSGMMLYMGSGML